MCENCKRLEKRIERLEKALIMKPTCNNPRRPFETHTFHHIDEVKLDFNAERVWLKFNGTCVFQAKAFNSRVLVEYLPQEFGEGVAHPEEKS
jgi:hypothetical protein